MMRAKEFITEESLDHHHEVALKGAVSVPGATINGSSYVNYRFGLALAGAPDYPTKKSGSFKGDPLLSTYTDEELDMINAAAKMVGAGKVKRLSSNRSTEIDNTHAVSPVAKPKRNKYGV